MQRHGPGSASSPKIARWVLQGFESLLFFQPICLSPDLIRNLNTAVIDTLKIRVQLRLPSRINLTPNFLPSGSPRRAQLENIAAVQLLQLTASEKASGLHL